VERVEGEGRGDNDSFGLYIEGDSAFTRWRVCIRFAESVRARAERKSACQGVGVDF